MHGFANRLICLSLNKPKKVHQCFHQVQNICFTRTYYPSLAGYSFRVNAD